MLFIKCPTLSEAKIINARVTTDCIAQSKWTDSVTNNYCNPTWDEDLQKWLVPILEGYESFFTDSEIENAMK
jgi:hypothetical protein